MKKYTIFLVFYLIYLIAFVFFMRIYFNSVVFENVELIETEQEANLFSTILTSPFIISGFITFLTTLVYRIYSIVLVARNKIINDGEKALWIVGFVMMGLITGFLFLILAKKRKLV